MPPFFKGLDMTIQQGGSPFLLSDDGQRIAGLRHPSGEQFVIGAAAPGYFVESDGPAYISGTALSLIVPKGTAVTPGGSQAFPTTTLTPPLPSLTVATITSGAVAYPNAITHLAKLSILVNNASGGSISGSFTVSGLDERGYALSDTVTVGSVSNGASTTVYTAKYFASLVSVSVASGTLGNSGVTNTFTEYQLRGYVSVPSAGVPEFNWTNTFAQGEIKVATFEARAAGIISVKNFSTFGPLPKRQRVGAEPVDWSGGTPESPSGWLGNCVYAADQMLDGRLVIAGNGSYMAEFNGQNFSAAYPVGAISGASSITTSDHILALLNAGKDTSTAKDEIVWLGTSTGKCVRWNRTQNTAQVVSLSGFSSNGVNKFIVGPQTNFILACGDGGKVNVLQDNGASAPTVYNYTTSCGFGSDAVKGGVFQDSCFYLVGGGASGLVFRGYVFNSHSFDLSTYLPGTSSQVGSSSGYFNGVIAKGDGELLLYGINSASATYLATWNTRQSFGRGWARFTTTGAATIPAGFTVGDGTRQYRTVAASSATGAGTVYAEIEAVTPGIAGCAARSTITTLVDSAANVSAVTNTQAVGMGRLIANGDGTAGQFQIPNGLAANGLLGGAFDGVRYILAMQGGDVLSYDGVRLLDITGRVEFKGRATGVFVAFGSTWVFGDEGKIFSIPN